jgi:GNAT superfamily N-acetyltransferase
VSRSIRPPDVGELETLRDVERAAGAMFVDVGMPEIAADEPFSIDELTSYLDHGRIWVAIEGVNIVGYALVDIVDGTAHLEQLSVDPQHGRRGHGAALLEHVYVWARDNGHDAVTLTTFEHVEWNAPYYARKGFSVMSEDELGPELQRLRDEETAHGLDPTIRVVMRRDLPNSRQ